MRWFKHDCDMHTDLRILSLLEKHGLEGYAIWVLCLEMVGKEGKKGKLKVELRWQEGLLKVCGWSDKGRLEKIINTLAELRLICPKSLKYGNLYIPKFIKRLDDYERRKLRTLSEQNTPKTKKVDIDKIIEVYIEQKNWNSLVKENKQMLSDIYKRNCRPAKELLVATNDVKKAELAIKRLSSVFKDKNLSWTLETVLKHLPDILIGKFKMTADEYPESLRKYIKKD